MSEYEIASLEATKIYNCIQIVLIFLTFLSVWFFYKDYKHRKEKEMTEKSILLAEQFAKKTIQKLSFISHIFETLELDKIINQVKFTRFLDFDIDELNELYSSDSIAKYNQIINKYDKDGKFHFLITSTLNELEYMCMYISTGVADKDCIYNSLHQQFFQTISYLYFHISLINVDNKNKYYTNVITVYTMWVEKYLQACKMEKSIKGKLKPKSKKIN